MNRDFETTIYINNQPTMILHNVGLYHVLNTDDEITYLNKKYKISKIGGSGNHHEVYLEENSK